MQIEDGWLELRTNGEALTVSILDLCASACCGHPWTMVSFFENCTDVCQYRALLRMFLARNTLNDTVGPTLCVGEELFHCSQRTSYTHALVGCRDIKCKIYRPIQFL